MKNQTLTQVQLKPLLIEGQLGTHEDFFKLSNRFKEALTNDRQDRKMILPISGYQGHRRGDRSHNFFGKSYRDITIQCKHLERAIRAGSPSPQ